MRRILLLASLLLLANCSHDAEDMYHYTPRAAGEVPAALLYYFTENPHTRDTLLAGQKTSYENSVKVCSVNGKPVGSMLGCGAQDAEEVARSNRVVLSPGRNEVRFSVTSPYLSDLSFTVAFDAQPGENYYTRTTSGTPQVTSSQLFAMHAGFANFPTPTVQLFNSKGQVLQQVTFQAQDKTTGQVSCSKTNANIYGGNPCPVINKRVTNYVPIYLYPAGQPVNGPRL